MPREVDFHEQQIHGKVGWVCAGVSNVVGAPLDVACTPVSVPIGVCRANDSGYGVSHAYGEIGDFWETILFPGVFVECLSYNVGASVAYPLYVVGDVVPGRVALWMGDGDSIVTEMMNSWRQVTPKFSRDDYGVLVSASGRVFAPAYHGQAAEKGLGNLLSPFEDPSLGRAGHITRWLSKEWEAWNDAGRPRGGRAEAAHVLEWWLMEGHYYKSMGWRGSYNLPTFKASEIRHLERITGVSRETVCATYWKSKEHLRPEADPGKGLTREAWKLWVQQNGGPDKILRKRYGDKKVSP